MMTLRRLLCLTCLLAALACLSGGYIMAGQRWAASAVLLPTAALWFGRRLPAAWLPSASLVSLVCLAAGGLFVRAPAFLMISGATAALAAWNLVNLDRAMAGSLPVRAESQIEEKHFLTLAVALGLSLLLAAAGKLLPLQIPFALLIVLVLLDLFSLGRVIGRMVTGSYHP
jgi:hypothetical protein